MNWANWEGKPIRNSCSHKMDVLPGNETTTVRVRGRERKNSCLRVEGIWRVESERGWGGAGEKVIEGSVRGVNVMYKWANSSIWENQCNECREMGNSKERWQECETKEEIRVKVLSGFLCCPSALQLLLTSNNAVPLIPLTRLTQH